MMMMNGLNLMDFSLKSIKATALNFIFSSPEKEKRNFFDFTPLEGFIQEFLNLNFY